LGVAVLFVCGEESPAEDVVSAAIEAGGDIGGLVLGHEVGEFLA
jgi:hypothetical protein